MGEQDAKSPETGMGRRVLNKFKRAVEITQDYGAKGLFAKISSRFEEPVTDERLIESPYVLVNDAPPPRKGLQLAPAVLERVVLTLTPWAHNVAAMEVGVVADAPGGELRVEIYDRERRILDHAVEVPQGRRMLFVPFAPLETGEPHPLVFILSTQGGAKILHDPKQTRVGFDLAGGGRIYARVFGCVEMDVPYLRWMASNEPDGEELARQRGRAFKDSPLFSVIVPLYNTPERYLREMIQSVVDQTYGRWELCLADGSDDGVDRKALCDSFADSRIRYARLDANEGIAGNTNRAMEMAKGDYLVLLDHDDVLAPQALYANADLICRDPDFEFIYSDEDKLTDGGGRRFCPFFKPDFSPELLEGRNYICHLSVFSRELAERVGGFRKGFDGSQDYDLIWRLTEQAKKVGHIREVLYHWRTAPTSTAFSASAKTYTEEASMRVLHEVLQRRGVEGATVDRANTSDAFLIFYPLPDPPPKVSIIVPVGLDGAPPAAGSLLSNSTYPDFEIIVVGGDSPTAQDARLRHVPWAKAYHPAAMLNVGARAANGEVLMFADPSARAATPGWLKQMVPQALREGVGAVTGLLVDEHGYVREAGRILYHDGIVAGAHAGCADGDPGPFGRLGISGNVSAASAACLMTRKALFDSEGGFDEEYRAGLFDADFCQRLIAGGNRVVYVPVKMYVSNDLFWEEMPMADQEESARVWLTKHILIPDPLYSPNLAYSGGTYTLEPGPAAIDVEQRLRVSGLVRRRKSAKR